MNTKIKAWIKSKDELNKFERKIINSHPEKLTNAVAEGERDIGKSMFCFITTTHIFQYLEGIHVDDAYIKALDHFIWTMKQFKDKVYPIIQNTDFNNIRQYDLENKYHILVIDDAGTHMGKYKFYTRITEVDKLASQMHTIRDVTSGLLITIPMFSGMLSVLREFPDVRLITIAYDREGNTDYDRKVEIRMQPKKWARKGKLLFPPIKGSVYVYDWAYDEYKVRKRKALQEYYKDEEQKPEKEINKMFEIAKKLNPRLTNEEIFIKLNLPQELINS